MCKYKSNKKITYDEMIDLIKKVTSNVFDFVEDTNMLEIGVTSLQIMRIANRFKKMGYTINFTELVKEPYPRIWWNKLNNQEKIVREVIYKVKDNECNKEEFFELTDVQYAYWIGRKDTQPLGGVSCHAYFEFDCKEIDLKRLSEAWNQLQLKHVMLRACFGCDGKQRILEQPFSNKIRIYNFTEIDKEDGLKKQNELREELSHRCLRIEDGQVAELGVSIISDNTMKIHFDIDLLVADLQSLQIIFKDIEHLYNGKNLEVTERWDFKEYLTEESEFNLSEKELCKEYWKNNIPNMPLSPKVPLFKNPNSIFKHKITRRKKLLSPESWNILKTKAAIVHTTPAMLLLTAYAETIERWSVDPKFLINIPMYNRQAHSKEIENVISDFTNIMLLPVDCTENMTFLERVKNIQNMFYECVQYSDYSGIQLQRDLSRIHKGEKFIAPFVFSCNYGESLVNDDFVRTFGNLTYMITQTPQVWNDFQVYEMYSGLLLAWDTVDELFPKNMMNEMFEYFSNFIDWIIKNPDNWEKKNYEYDKLSNDNNQISNDISIQEDKCIHESFIKYAKTNGSKIAVVNSHSGEEFSYNNVLDNALRIATYFSNIGVKRGDFISISLPRGIEQIYSILGVVLIGASYVPVSIEQPFERRKSIYKKASIKYIITDSEHKTELKWPENTTVIDVNTMLDTQIENFDNQVSPKDCAYVIFTSGSTGKPKGVKISHGAAWNTINDIIKRYNINSEDAVLAISSFDFDLSVFDIFGLLSVGGRIVLVPESEKRNAFFWLKSIKNFNVTVWNSVPTLLNMLLIVAENNSNSIDPIRLSLISGDWIELDMPEKYYALTQDAKFIALGGATEASIWSNYFEVKLPIPDEWVSIPYGSALSNQVYRVCDTKGRDCPNWVPGELLIGGKGVAEGYVGEIELTNKSFINQNEISWYKTGDIGRKWSNGTIEFLGRKDEQVKVRGHRIEIAEIEKALCKHCLINNAVVSTIGEEKENKYLVAFVVLNEKFKDIIKEIDKQGLDKFLMENIPEYMVPKRVEIVEELPLTANGKVDRKCLDLIANKSNKKISAIENNNLPQAEIEILISKVWKEIFGCENIYTNDDYFELGGDSLLATRMCTKLNEAFNVNIQIESIFKYHKFLDQSKYIDKLVKNKDFNKKEKVIQMVSNNEEKYLPFPMTDIQKAYWIGRKGIYSLGEVSTHYYFELEEENLDIVKLTDVWNKLIGHHDMMRAVVLEDGQNQKILKDVKYYDIEVFDLSNNSLNEVNTHIEKIRDKIGHQKLDETKWPLFEVKITNIPSNKSRIHISFDNIIYDGWSIFMILSQWNKLYINEEIDLNPLDVSFRDYVISLEKIKESDLYKKDKKYWSERIKTLPPAPELPTIKNVDTSKSYGFSHMERNISSDMWNKIKERGKKYGITPSVILLTAYSEIICAYSKKPDYTLNLTRFNRLNLHEQIDEMVGDFTSLTLLSIHNRKGDTFADRCHNIQNQLSKDLAHPYICGVEVQREIAKQRGSSNGALMPVVFTSAIGLNNKKSYPDNWIGKRVYTCSETPQVWLDHQVIEDDDGIVLIWDAAKNLFPENMIKEMFELYNELMENLSNDDIKWDCTKNIIRIPESKAVIEANNTEQPISRDTLIDLFYKSVEQYYHEEAVVTSYKRLTYKDLFQKSKSVRDYLQTLNVRKGDKVLLIMEKGYEQIISVLGILMAGAVYVPIDPYYPKERIEYILSETKSKVAITQKKLKEDLSYILISNIVDIDEIDSCNTEGCKNNEITVLPEDLAYIIYTSGSTGKPKGVMIDHKGAVNTIIDINKRFNVDKDRIFGLSNLTFDLSVYDIFGALSSGSCIILPDNEKIKDPVHWTEIMQNEKITIWNSVPQFMQMLIEYISCQEKGYKFNLRLSLLSGDWIPLDLPEKMKKHFRGIQVVSLGGATEASIWSNEYIINDIDKDWDSIPYGKPLTNQKFYILNEFLNNCPTWVSGKLYIGGIGLAKGYLNDTENTKTHFITHPENGEKIYFTGDLGRYLPDGNIEFLGREDSQVKVGGYRIELGEIEHALSSVNGIKQAIVTTIGDKSSNQHLIANIILDKGNSDDLKNIISSDYDLPIFNSENFIRTSEIEKLCENIKIKSEKLSSYFEYSEGLSISLMCRILEEIGVFKKDIYSLEEIMCETGINEKFSGLIKNWHKILVKEKIAIENENIFHIKKDMLKKQLLLFEDDIEKISQINIEFKSLFKSLQGFFLHDISGYIDILLDNKKMAELFIEDDNFFNSEKVGQLNPLQKDFENILINVVLDILESNKDNKIKFIEIGSRTNELASSIDKKLGNYNCEYIYTDESQYILDKKKQKNLANVAYSKLNINNSMINQGYSNSSSHVIIANNSLHRSKNIYKTLHYMGEVIKSGGILLILEPVKNSNLALSTVGLYEEGFSNYEDFRKESMLPILSKEEWESILCECNFDVKSISIENMNSAYEQCVFIAYNKNIQTNINLYDIKDMLKEKLPNYMIPNIYVETSSFPLNSNGKIDRKKIKELNKNNTEIFNKEVVLPKTEIQHSIYSAWKKILKCESLSVTNNFFEVGGDSISAIQCVNLLKNNYNIEISLKDLFESSSIKELESKVNIIEEDEVFVEKGMI
ncbi:MULTISPECIES: non-ribosomal peptide synthetase [Clostridium]|uniref:non-ribosomal peptide synthetase n=1 Tax=Clostridium TaxID=1485 RepID=UPI0013F82156|nr:MULTISPECIES: non-ribosomal peptide synthetase [Clostridium]MBY7025342.1 amino acid adenylation domain-containing protein [Clostridium botulinum]NFO30766.1 amino acid adenylation domain-containing protein [Clostridium botulinum]NFO47908.1 amino acid adenylation domain-containing protein [Clostridium botulinum]NFO53723.1 amino acid adenylation domain-containing protein [Clostridium botulinum]